MEMRRNVEIALSISREVSKHAWVLDPYGNEIEEHRWVTFFASLEMEITKVLDRLAETPESPNFCECGVAQIVQGTDVENWLYCVRCQGMIPPAIECRASPDSGEPALDAEPPA